MSLRHFHPKRFAILGVAIGLGAVLLLAGTAAGAAQREVSPEPDTAWHEGAAGFTGAFERARDDGQPVLIYFYTDWCGYCRQLESKLLERPEVEDYTQYLVKIRINPEHGPDEQLLARQYGVSGYPAVFVHAAVTERPKRIARMVVEGGKRRLMTPEEFVDTLSKASGETAGAS